MPFIHFNNKLATWHKSLLFKKNTMCLWKWLHGSLGCGPSHKKKNTLSEDGPIKHDTGGTGKATQISAAMGSKQVPKNTGKRK